MELDKNIETFEFLKDRWPLKQVLKALIDLNEIDQRRLARESGVSDQSMWSTTNRHRNHPKAMAAISRRLGIPVRELFDGKQ